MDLFLTGRGELEDIALILSGFRQNDMRRIACPPSPNGAQQFAPSGAGCLWVNPITMDIASMLRSNERLCSTA